MSYFYSYCHPWTADGGVFLQHFNIRVSDEIPRLSVQFVFPLITQLPYERYCNDCPERAVKLAMYSVVACNFRK